MWGMGGGGGRELHLPCYIVLRQVRSRYIFCTPGVGSSAVESRWIRKKGPWEGAEEQSD